MAPGRPIPHVALFDGAGVPALGLGTWHMGERKAARGREADALRTGIGLGMTLIDTAEMYGDGGAEEVVGDAIANQRDRVFVVSKVYPHNAGRKSAIAACDRSLARLRTDRIDLYLLHWRGSIPLAETVGAFERLRNDGKILRWGVSNFDVHDLEELFAVPEGRRCAANQILYNLEERAVEWRLAALCRDNQVAVMAYSPLGEGPLLRNRKLIDIAHSAGVEPAALALAWTMRDGNTIAIPKSSQSPHVRENRRAADFRIDAATLDALDRAFPPPRRAQRISVI